MFARKKNARKNKNKNSPYLVDGGGREVESGNLVSGYYRGIKGEPMKNSVKIGDWIIASTADNIYEGEVLEITETRITMTYFNVIKDDTREVELPLNEIDYIEQGA